MTLEEARKYIHNKLLNIRNIENLLNREIFEQAYGNLHILDDDCFEFAVEEFAELIHNCRYEGLRYWMVHHLDRDLTELTISELRALAQQYFIIDYDRMRKDQLIHELEYERQKYRRNQTNN
jgi:hypothetical protein